MRIVFNPDSQLRDCFSKKSERPMATSRAHIGWANRANHRLPVVRGLVGGLGDAIRRRVWKDVRL